MKILISVSYYAPHLSGLTNSIKNLAELLVAEGYQVDVVTTQHTKNLALEETMQGVHVLRIPYLLKMSKGFAMPSFISQMYTSLRKTDTVLINLPQFEGVLVAVLAKCLEKKVVSIYACEVTMQPGIFAKFAEHLLRFMNRLCLLFSDSIVTLTEDFAKHTPTLAKFAGVKAIYPVVLPPDISEKAREVLLKKMPDQKKYHIGFLGRIAAEKGIEYLLEALPLLQKTFHNDLVIILAGPTKTVGEGRYRQKINALLEKSKDYIVQLGELSQDEMGAFYSLLDVFVLPSINQTEAFGMVQVEAMYCGTPVVATDLPGVRVPVTVTGMGEIVPVKNAASLAKAIGHILQNKNNYRKSREQIGEVFSSKKIAAAYKKLVE